MYCMGTYQAPQVPQPGVTFGDERFVDPWAATMLQNICSNLQVQNMALQQENAALKNKSQSLQQQRENPLCKAANRAYLREFTAYKTESLVEFPDGRYHLVKKNPLGELYKVVKPVSDCTEFSARYVIDPRDGSTSIEVRYRLPNGTLSGFRVADDKFQQNALIQGFYKSGGTLRCGKDGPRLFYMLVAQLLSKHEIYFQPIPGWNINASRWFFKESAGCEAPLDSPILRPDALTSEDQMMMAAVIGLSFLKTRLPEDMQPTKPFAVISESFSITTEITLNCKLAELKKQLNHHRDDLLIHVRGGFASNRYQKATNYDYLSDEAEKGSTSRSIYIVQAKELTPEIREHCIPIQLNPAEACSATTGVDSVTWGDLISLVEGNPNEFDSRVYRAYKEERDRMEGSSFCQEIAVLRAVSEIICWTFSQKASLSEEKVRDAYKTAFDHYPSRWDSMLNTTASDCFRNALYAAAREQTIRFRDIDDLDETYCKEKEVLYDEYVKQGIPALAIDINQTMSPEHICKALSPEFESLVIRHNLYRKAVASDLMVAWMARAAWNWHARPLPTSDFCIRGNGTMKEFEYTVQDQLGIHARPAGQIAKLAKAHPDCEISFAKIGGSKTANAARVMALMSLGAKPGDVLHITVEGANEESVTMAMQELLNSEKL